MHYRDLEIAHEAFYEIEPRAYYYDSYMKSKKYEDWGKTVSTSEVEKLFRFTRSWDHHFDGDEAYFQQIYAQIVPQIKVLKNKSIEGVELEDEETEKAIESIFDDVANLVSYKYQSTDCSKMLHTILPSLIVMWDREIRRGILGSPDKNWGTVYVWEFLPKMQREAREAIATFGQSANLPLTEAMSAIERNCGHTLAKLLDEHNYVIFTKPDKFKLFLQTSLKKGKIANEEYQRLIDKLLYTI